MRLWVAFFTFIICRSCSLFCLPFSIFNFDWLLACATCTRALLVYNSCPRRLNVQYTTSGTRFWNWRSTGHYTLRFLPHFNSILCSISFHISFDFPLMNILWVIFLRQTWADCVRIRRRIIESPWPPPFFPRLIEIEEEIWVPITTYAFICTYISVRVITLIRLFVICLNISVRVIA